MLIVFEDMIADIEAYKKLSPTVTELLLRGGKRNVALDFMSQSYLEVPKTIRVNTAHYFIMIAPNKRVIQQIASNH